MIIMKQIKSARLKDKAMRLTLLNEMRSIGKDIEKDFEKTTKTWKKRPEFESLISLTGPGPVLFIGTDNEVWKWVDEGTKPHQIWAGIYTGKSKKKALAFQRRFTPKTIPGVIGSRAGRKWGGLIVRPYVEHPGTKPRKFGRTIQKRWKRRFQVKMQKGMKKAAKKSGHKI